MLLEGKKKRQEDLEKIKKKKERNHVSWIFLSQISYIS